MRAACRPSRPPRAPIWPTRPASCTPRTASSRWTCRGASPRASCPSSSARSRSTRTARRGCSASAASRARCSPQATPEQRAVLEAYARGVNAGLAELCARARGSTGCWRSSRWRGGPRTRCSSSTPCGGTCRRTACGARSCGARSTRASAARSARAAGSARCSSSIRPAPSGTRPTVGAGARRRPRAVLRSPMRPDCSTSARHRQRVAAPAPVADAPSPAATAGRWPGA